MEHSFQHSKTFRYETHNASDADVLIYVLHGYGHLAKFFIRKFQQLGENVMVVAPEGMHRFYRNGNSGRVGASWMTKEARETDIRDNIEWLDALDAKLSESHSCKHKLLLGFSQGGSTAIRWAMHGKTPFDGLVIWATDFPPDEIENADLLSKIGYKHFVIGSNDEFFNEDRQRETIAQFETFQFKISTYIGEHDINQNHLIEIIQDFLETT